MRHEINCIFLSYAIYRRWKFSQLAMEMLTLLLRHDVELPPSAVSLFTKRIIDDTLQVRKVGTNFLGTRPTRLFVVCIA